MTVIVSCIFRPLDAHEKDMRSREVVKCHNDLAVIVQESVCEIRNTTNRINDWGVFVTKSTVEKITKTFPFDEVFDPDSKQVSMSFFISLMHLLLLLLLLSVIYIYFSVCVISCRKLGSKTIAVASSSISFILN